MKERKKRRRQMTKGQIAMIAAVRLFRTEHSDPDKQQEQSIRRAAKVTGIPLSTLAKAIAVKQYAPDLAPGIIAGKLFLDPAYATAHADVAYPDTALSTRPRGATFRQMTELRAPGR